MPSAPAVRASFDEPSSPAALGYRMPAEWEPHAATWLAWPHQESDWPGKFSAVSWVFVEMARVLAEGERIRLIVRDAAERRRAARALADSGVALEAVDFFRAPTDRSWTRDFVPTFVVRGRAAKGRARVMAVKWRFDGWARYANHRRDQAAGRAVPEWLGVPCFEPAVRFRGRRRSVVLEGGAIDVDGEGTLLATEECLLSGPQARNAGLGRAGTEAVLRDALGVERVIWLGRGIAGDDTGGHVDDFARFVAPGRVVVAREPNGRDANHRVLAAARERLRGARDARGRRLDVIELPMPAPIAFRAQRLPASYANFYVGSSAVLVPTFDDPHDRTALGVLAELFPGRRVVGIHARDLVLGLGTLHCSTQQEPR